MLRCLFKIIVSDREDVTGRGAHECQFELKGSEGCWQLAVQGAASDYDGSRGETKVRVCFRGEKEELQEWAHVR